MGKEVVKQGEIKTESVEPSVDNLIALAIEKNVDVGTMEKLLAMRKELKEEKAREVFFESLSKLQSELPEIPKNKTVKNKDGTVRYRYADLPQILKYLRPLLERYGFSYMIDTKFEKDPPAITVYVSIHHTMGHTQKVAVRVPIDKSGYMNPTQQHGSAISYAKRYALCDAFGILTADEDNDAISAYPEKSENTSNNEKTQITEALKSYMKDQTLPQSKRKAIASVLARNPDLNTLKFLLEDVKKTYEKILETQNKSLEGNEND